MLAKVENGKSLAVKVRIQDADLVDNTHSEAHPELDPIQQDAAVQLVLLKISVYCACYI